MQIQSLCFVLVTDQGLITPAPPSAYGKSPLSVSRSLSASPASRCCGRNMQVNQQGESLPRQRERDGGGVASVQCNVLSVMSPLVGASLASQKD